MIEKLRSKRGIIKAVLAICLVLTILYIMVDRSFEPMRTRQIGTIQNYVLVLRNDLYNASNWDFEEAPVSREAFMYRSQLWVEVLSEAFRNLALLYGGASGSTDFPRFNLGTNLNYLFLHADEPHEELRWIADELMVLYERIDPTMPAWDLFDIVNETNARLNARLPLR